MVKHLVRFSGRFLSAFYAATLIFTAASPLMATGIGLYGGAALGRQTWEKKSGHEWNAGGGIIVDTALAKDTLFNYRFSLGCDQEQGFQYIDKPVPYTYRLMTFTSGTDTYNFMQTSSAYYKSKVPVRPLSINMYHAFGFGVVRTPMVRFWLGPELSVSGMFKAEFDMKKFWGIRGGLGLILGLNINPGDLVTISFTGSGRVEYAYRVSKYSQYKIEYITIPPPLPVPLPVPSIPISKKSVSLKDKGFRFGGQFNVAILFRVGDTYSEANMAPAAK